MTQNTQKFDIHLRTIAQFSRALSPQLRHISTIGKCFKQQYLLHMPHNMTNFCSITAEIGWRDWGTPANFNGFCVFASLVHRRRLTKVNQTLHDVWPSPGLVHYIYILGLLSPKRILPGAKFALRPSLAFSCTSSVTARHSSSGRQPNFVAW